MVRALVHAMVVVLLALVTGCTGFVSISLFFFSFLSSPRVLTHEYSVVVLSAMWLVPSVHKGPPKIMEKQHRYIPLVQPRAPP